MALTYQDINAYTTQHIVPRSTDVIFKNSPLLTRMITKQNVKFEGGLFVQTPLIYAELNGGAFGKGGQFDISVKTTDTALTNYMKYYYVNISLYGTDSVLSRGPEAAFTIAETKMKNASLTMAKKLAVAFYQDGQSTQAAVDASGGVLSTSLNFDGLLAWVDDGSTYNSYNTATTVKKSFTTIGGITRSEIQATNSTADATPDANVGGLNSYVNRAFDTFTLAELNTAYGNAQFGNESVDMITGTRQGWNKIWSSMQPTQRFMNGSDSDLCKVGFRAFQFNGADVVVDQYCPANLMLGLNTSYIFFNITSEEKYQFGFTGFKVAQNTDDVAGQYLFAGDLILSNPRTSFKMIGSSI